jgi:hypothetical protein
VFGKSFPIRYASAADAFKIPFIEETVELE